VVGPVRHAFPASVLAVASVCALLAALPGPSARAQDRSAAAQDARVPLDFLLGGAGSCSAASLRFEDGGRRVVLDDVRLAAPGVGLTGEGARVTLVLAAPGRLPTLAGSAVEIRGGRFTLSLGVGEATAESRDRRPERARRGRPGEARPLVRLLGRLGRAAGPLPEWLPTVQVGGGAQLTLALADRTVTLTAVEASLRPGESVVARVRLADETAGGALEIRAGWPSRGPEGELRAEARVALRGGRLAHPAIADEPLEGLAAEAELRLVHDPRRGTLAVEAAPLDLRGLRARVRVDARRVGRGALTARVTLALPAQPCQALVAALPPALAPLLAGARLEGELEGTLVADLALGRREGPLERLAVRGPSPFRGCRLATLGPAVDVDRLAGPFVQRVDPPRAELPSTTVGPGTRDYVRLGALPAPVVRAMLLTEDAGFYHHGPLSLGLLAKAINRNLAKGRYVYGGSTISQQLVKNLYLDGRKTLGRKVQELFIAWQMEQTISKDRILELYVNCIEFAPGIYGIERAARYYFGRPATELTPVEGVFLATIKPLPSDGPRMARRGVVDGWWAKRVAEVMEKLAAEGLLSEEERAAAEPYQPDFRSDFEAHSRRVLGVRP
jgi:hypothetical protein